MLDFEKYMNTVTLEQFREMVPNEEDRLRMAAGAVAVIVGTRAPKQEPEKESAYPPAKEEQTQNGAPRQYRKNNFFPHGTLKRIADKCGISATYLSNVFMRRVDMGLKTAVKVSEVAKGMGYNIPPGALAGAKTTRHNAFVGEPLK